jgi:6-phosphofructokinase 1
MTNAIGILTSGGDAPGMNAVIASACERIENAGARAYGVLGGFAGLARRRIEPITAAQAEQHAHEPGTWLGSSRWPELREPAGRDACLGALEAAGLDALLVIGGDGSARGAAALAAESVQRHAEGSLGRGAGLTVAVIPATIDRDLEATNLTIGMDSAVAFAVDTIDRLRITGRSVPGRAFVVQTLGAPHGFLAEAVAAAAGIEDVIVPERPTDLDALAARLRELAVTGSAIAVMSEAAGDAVRVAEALRDRAKIRVHPTILGHAQRAATPSPLDLALGDAAGRAAVDALLRGESTFLGLEADGAVALSPLLAPATFISTASTDTQGAPT